VPISLNIRGLCCLRPGVPGLSENIRLFSVVGRFLEHSRVYRFVNGGEEEIFIGSADWMKRNLDRRVELVTPILDPKVRADLSAILATYETDNASAWECKPDGEYVQRRPADGEEVMRAQESLMRQNEPDGDDDDRDEPDDDLPAALPAGA
jgi:polyphosphate kinase